MAVVHKHYAELDQMLCIKYTAGSGHCMPGYGVNLPAGPHQNLPLWLPLIHLVAATLCIDLMAPRKRT